MSPLFPDGQHCEIGCGGKGIYNKTLHLNVTIINTTAKPSQFQIRIGNTYSEKSALESGLFDVFSFIFHVNWACWLVGKEKLKS